MNLDTVREFLDIELDSRAIFTGLNIMNTEYAGEINTRPVLAFSFKDCKGDRESLMELLKGVLIRQFLVFKDAVMTLPETRYPLNRRIRPLRGRVLKENIFSDLNNLVVCDATSNHYSDHFGFTESEVKELLAYYEVPFTDEVRLMYDGYRFGNSEIYNPWSLVNYAQNKELVAYWVNTSGSSLISKNIAAASPAFIAAFDKLVLEGKTRVAINLRSGTYEGMNDESLWGLLVSAGYLTFAEKPSGNPTDTQVLRFPNGDVRQDFQRIVAERTSLTASKLNQLFDALVNKRDVELFTATYKEIILEATSYHDAKENAAPCGHSLRANCAKSVCVHPWTQRMLLGMCIFLQGRYEVKSNIESGHGRSDIVLRALRTKGMNVVIKLKEGPDTATLADEALAQIKERQYTAGLKGEVLLLGVAHHKKQCDVRWTRV